MRYFVTGGTGFIGEEVVRQLSAAGHEVVALARNPLRAANISGLPGVEIAKGDITDRESLREPMAGADGVFHIAGWYKVGEADPQQGERINVEGTRNVLTVMRDLGIPRGVYTSTVAVFSNTHGRLPDETYRHDGPHLTAYDRTKWEAHHLVADLMIDEGLPLVIVMPGLVYGPGDTSAMGAALRDYLKGDLPVIPGGAGYCWAHVEDVARAHLLAMEKGRPGESYIVAGPCHTLVEALAIAEEATGVPAPRLTLPAWAGRALAPVMGLVGKMVDLPPGLTAEGLRASCGTTYMADNSKARRELGYAPRTLREGLPTTLAGEMRALGMDVPPGLGEKVRRAEPFAHRDRLDS